MTPAVSPSHAPADFSHPALGDAPMVWYCTEEVRRQGHSLRTLDGVQRVGWMLDAWARALVLSHLTPYPSVRDIAQLGRIVEPVINRDGFRRCGVRVGLSIKPPYERVRPMLHELIDQGHSAAPLVWYRTFEEIHPFRDGNGRTGKILMNWIAGTLRTPFFPPHEFWGGWVENP